MQCPTCKNNGSKVIDSRPSDDGKSIRRRRECEQCGTRFTTFERTEQSAILVVKKNGNREEFSREKLLRGIRRACEKRPIPAEVQESVVSQVERQIRDDGKSEVDSTEIGKYVMDQLAHIDDVAYIRFASVYREFKDIGVFMEEMKAFEEKKK
ncbi:transcriptional regulator NrdR [Dolosigranulum pigrum]|jgi:transcriptional regulator nrdR|uniref:Transcriptional repressor NrdR n=3 Tax=Dolosigranulum TaxID=29393 RepID=H3NF93_9LACT|nr:transcriptional regulator NrdR [Dolosigranulum pigrum]EHR33108.1 transcriptional regulator NrdR [Dolosigranulum pigrum ATCC 51524]OOL80734.1 transcriptional regulator NrdR [Dolosigranulum pigrum]QDO91289.1 transcriptional repressor NrdR [Dolosigranulum pigrum]QJS96642.1 transcriptional repressor NrdR [Dolosigranulum pigrum]QJS98125.1 transcriptional repressor NrdR [Dolosigranulum pigrum]